MIKFKKHPMCALILLLSGIAMLFGSSSPVMAGYATTPSAYWQLEEDGGPFVDYTGAVDDADCNATGCPTIEDPAQVGAGQTFGGGTGIDIPANAVFDWAEGASFSIELWMKIAAAPVGSRQVMIGRHDAADDTDWFLSVETSGRVGAWFVDADSDDVVPPALATGTSIVADDAWHHVVVVRDGTPLDQLRIYVDGELDIPTPIDQTGNTYTDQSFASSAIVTLGYSEAGVVGQYDYDGSLDNIAIYSSTALSDAQVLENYNTGADGDALDEATADPIAGGGGGGGGGGCFIAAIQSYTAPSVLFSIVALLAAVSLGLAIHSRRNNN